LNGLSRIILVMHPNLLLLLLMSWAPGRRRVGAVIAIMAWSLIHPPRMTDGKPRGCCGDWGGRLGLASEEMPFISVNHPAKAEDRLVVDPAIQTPKAAAPC